MAKGRRTSEFKKRLSKPRPDADNTRMPRIFLWAKPFFGFLALNAVIAALGSLSTLPLPEWYTTMTPAPWSPPDWLFGPAWSVLYTLMAVAAANLWLKRHTRAGSNALVLYAMQLFANAIWTPLFFGKGWVGLALSDLGLLLVILAACLYHAFKADKWAGALLTPYFLWICYAGTLNAYVYVHLTR